MHTTISLLRAQFYGVHWLCHHFGDDLTETEWTTRVYPNTVPLGFTLWHIARAWDWAVQTVIRGVPEVSADERWAAWRELEMAGFGAGVSLEQTTEIAQGASRDDVLAYVDTVYATILHWLDGLSEADLEAIPAMEAHTAPYPAYQLPSSRAETDDLVGLPTWRLLSGVCSAHLREHLGEVSILKQILRGEAEQ